MKLRIIAAGLLISLTPLGSFADTGTYRRPPPEPIHTTVKKDYTFKEKSYFRDNEFSADLFGSYTFADGSGRLSDDWGGGLGLNYFVSRNLGLGLDAYWWDGDRISNEVVTAVSGSIILRLPMDSVHLAPYLLGGAGGTFSGVDQLTFHGGLGMEYRFTPHVGTFVDGRYVFADDTNNYGLVRFGFRYAF
jgi:hypothetical protein